MIENVAKMEKKKLKIRWVKADNLFKKWLQICWCEYIYGSFDSYNFQRKINSSIISFYFLLLINYFFLTGCIDSFECWLIVALRAMTVILFIEWLKSRKSHWKQQKKLSATNDDKYIWWVHVRLGLFSSITELLALKSRFWI